MNVYLLVRNDGSRFLITFPYKRLFQSYLDLWTFLADPGNYPQDLTLVLMPWASLRDWLIRTSLAVVPRHKKVSAIYIVIPKEEKPTESLTQAILKAVPPYLRNCTNLVSSLEELNSTLA